MTPEELRRRRVGAFRKLAGEELDAAKLLADGHVGQAAYFLQQCVEKLARGVLEVSGIAAGPTHQILQLARQMNSGAELIQRFVDLDELSVAATRYRYPSPTGDVRSMSKKDLAILLVKVEGLYNEVAPLLNSFSGLKV